MTTYQTDFYSWTQQQAALLKARKFNELDFDNLIKEIESMGASEKKELDSRCVNCCYIYSNGNINLNEKAAVGKFRLQNNAMALKKYCAITPA